MLVRRPSPARWLTLGIAMFLWFPSQPMASAQTATEYQVKAAYLYNFAKFVEWPARNIASPTAPITLCVLDDPSFVSELNRIVKSKSVASHPVSVVPVHTPEQSRKCHVLFINASHDGQTRYILEELRDTSVLTVGEAKGFVEDGGIINFVLQDDRVQFQVNRKAAKRAGLSISSRLLAVAKLVLE
jgi:uncharacterized protein DUF4154